MSEPKMYENIDELQYSEVTDNLLAWLEIDVKKRKDELDDAKKRLEFFQELLDDAKRLHGIDSPSEEAERGARWRLELITKRRLLHKMVDGWDKMSIEEMAEYVYRSDDDVTQKYFQDYSPEK